MPPDPAKHRTILERVRREILTGRLTPGSQLPPRTQLERRFDASPVTVQRVMDTLLEHGFIQASSRGTYVSDCPPHLCHFGLVSAERVGPSLYLRSMLDAARQLESPTVRFTQYFYDRGHRESAGFIKLQQDVANHCLAGLIFLLPPFRLEGTPALEQKGQPRVLVNPIPGAFGDIDFVTLNYKALLPACVESLVAQGRRRIAVLGCWLHERDYVVSRDMLVSQGVSQPLWVHNVHPAAAWGAAQQVQLLMAIPRDCRPNGLIILDDHLTEATTQGLLQARVSADELAIVSHCNYPTPPQAHVPVSWVGLDCVELMRRCLAVLEGQRRNQPHDQHTLLEPRNFDAIRDAGVPRSMTVTSV